MSSLSVGASAAKVNVAGLNDAISLFPMFATSIVPLVRTVDWASPIAPVPPPPAQHQFAGTVICADHVFATGSYMNPMLVSTTIKLLYSPPMTTTRPSGSTADAKYNGWYGQFTHPIVGSLAFGMAATVKPGTSHKPF